MRARVLALLLATSSATADTTRTYTGKVLPFEIIAAIRNYGVTKGGILPAQIAISFEGGIQEDWLAAAAYVADSSAINDVTFATVDVYVPNPWGDMPPQGKKRLANAYYAGPEPSRSPWPDQQWLVMAQGHAPTLADVESDVLADKLLGEEPPSDDDRASDAATAKATRLIVENYGLPKYWKPEERLGALDPQSVHVTDRLQIVTLSSECQSALKVGSGAELVQPAMNPE